MSDSAAHELSTTSRRRAALPTPVPVDVEARPRGPLVGMIAYPVLIVVSIGAHGILLAALALVPIVETVRAEPEPIAFEVLTPEPRPEPPPARIEPPVAPPVAAIAEPPRRRVRRDTPPTPEPAPPAQVITTQAPGASDWTQPEGEPDGQLGGVPEGTGTALPSGDAHAAVAEEAREGISRAALRRILAGYIRDTLSRFLADRIDYPLAARREHLEGVVVLRVRLARDGRILAVRLARSSGHSMLDTAALASVQGIGSMPAPPQQIPWDDARELPLPVNYVLR